MAFMRLNSIKGHEIIVLLALFLIVFLYFLLIFDWKNNIFTQWLALRRSKRKGPVTSSPIVPTWLSTQQSEGSLSSITLSAVFIQRRSSSDPDTPKMKPAIIWAQSEVRTIFNFLKKPGDHSCFELPSDTCTLSVPMNHFKCGGESCTDFQPTSGTASGAFYSYQMLGEHKIQLVHYHENHKAYPAGVVIYIEDPYADSFNYNGEMLREFVKNSRFHEDPAKERVRKDETLEMEQ